MGLEMSLVFMKLGFDSISWIILVNSSKKTELKFGVLD